MNGLGSSINTMLLGGLALAFSRLIDDSVVVLENIFRFMENGAAPREAAEKGGMEVALAVLAATSTTSIVFFPVTFSTESAVPLHRSAQALVLDFAPHLCNDRCAALLRTLHPWTPTGRISRRSQGLLARIVHRFNHDFQRLLLFHEKRWRSTEAGGRHFSSWAESFYFAGVFPFVGQAYFRTDPGQFVIDLKMPTGTRLEVSDKYVADVEREIRAVFPDRDLDMIVSNIGITPDLSAIYTSNSAMHTAFVQVSLKEDHEVGSYEYMERVRRKLASGLPQVSAYFQAGGLVDSVVNQGLPAPLDIQVGDSDLGEAYAIAQKLALELKGSKNVSDVLIPQDIDYPGLELNIDRQQASLLGLTPKDVVDNVITALTSNGVIAPSYWIDPKTGNNYMLTVQYSNEKVGSMTMSDFRNIPLRATTSKSYTPLQSVAKIVPMNTPTEVDHYQLRRVIDVFVMPKTEDLSKVNAEVNKLVSGLKLPKNARVRVQGAVVGMNESFFRFGVGLMLSVILVYLILMAQFRSFIDPFIILTAIPPGLAGVVAFLFITHTTLNIMSLMGVIMMTGIVVSNSILIVEFSGILHEQGMALQQAVVEACKVRLRPILMTSLATLLGLIPMALGVEAGSEQYAPLARAVIGGLGVSVVVTVFLVPAVYLMIHGRKRAETVEVAS
jgi:multidrug efflux pump subunit AcrB